MLGTTTFLFWNKNCVIQFCILDLSCFSILYMPERIRVATRLKPIFACGISAGLALLMTYFASAYDVAKKERDLVQNLTAQAGLLRANLERDLHRNLSASSGIAAFIALNPEIEADTFRSLAQGIVQRFPSIRCVQLAPGSIVRFAYPEKANETILGQDLKEILPKEQVDAFERAITERRQIIAGPVQLLQGGEGIISRSPVYAGPGNATYWGLVTMIIDTDIFYEQAGLSKTIELPSCWANIAIRGKDGRGIAGDVFFGDATLFNLSPLLFPITIPNGEWEMAVVPAPEYRPKSSAIICFGGLAVAILIGAMAYLLTSAKVRHNTKLLHAKLNWETELDASYAKIEALNADLTTEKKSSFELKRELDQQRLAYHSIQDRFQAIFHNAGTATAIVDEAYVLKVVNANFAKLAGAPIEDLQNSHSLLELTTVEDMDRLRDYMRHCREEPGTKVPQFEYSFVPRNGYSFPVIANLAVIPNHSQAIVSLVSIAEYKHLQSQLEKAKRMESTAILAGGIAHDFNNLMSIIMGNVEMVKMTPMADQTPRRIDSALNAIREATRLTEKFLVSAGAMMRQHEKVNIEKLIREQIKEVFGDNSSCKIRIMMQEGMPDLVVDKQQMARAIREILKNSLEAMPEEGAMTIMGSRAETIFLPDRAILPRNTSGFMQIAFEDSGGGIKQQDLEHVFDPYFTTKQRGKEKGTGLGLTLAYAIIKAHGGLVQVSSFRDTGTSVFVHLPLINPNIQDDSD